MKNTGKPWGSKYMHTRDVCKIKENKIKNIIIEKGELCQEIN